MRGLSTYWNDSPEIKMPYGFPLSGQLNASNKFCRHPCKRSKTVQKTIKRLNGVGAKFLAMILTSNFFIFIQLLLFFSGALAKDVVQKWVFWENDRFSFNQKESFS